MSAKDGETKFIHCKFTQKLIDKALNKNIKIIDFGDNLLNVKKSKALCEYLNI